MTTTPPGWYDDGHGALRWWDGTQWTEHVAQPDAESSPAPTEAEIVAAQLGFEPQETAAGVQPEASVQSDASAPSAYATQPGAAQPAYAGAASAVGVQPGVPSSEVPAPPAYPNPQGAYPGTPAGSTPAGGAFAAATEPRKSKLWIVWVVLGVVLLGIVIAAAVLIPLLILSASAANSSAQSDDERAAVAAVGLYDEAWQEGDCDKLAAATTEDFRATVGLNDCVAFQDQAATFTAGIEDYTVNVTDVETLGDEITVATNETYTALVDENGDPTEPTDSALAYQYTLVQSGGDWLIEYIEPE